MAAATAATGSAPAGCASAVRAARSGDAVDVTHDLAVVAQMADRILVLKQGRERETGTTEHIIEAPEDEYTKSLVAAAMPAARPSAATGPEGPTPLLDVRNLFAGYGTVDASGMPAVPVLADVSLTLHRGQALGVIGESGSGKTTLARVIAGLVAPARGDVLFDGKPLGASLSKRSRDDLRRIQIVFQMADTALNPSHRSSE